MSTLDEYRSIRGWPEFERLASDRTRTGEAEFRVVTSDYFATMGIPRVSGRLFEDRDGPDAPHVAVISASLAKTKWPNENPVGKFIEFGNMDGDLREFTIVGVVADVREASLAATPRPTFYALYRQRPRLAPIIVIAVTGDPTPVMASARHIVRDVRPDVAPRIRTMESIVSRSVADRRFALLLIGVFAGVALAVAALGVYSVISYLVTQREREISIRVALGARAADIVRLVVGQGATMVFIGIAVGALASVGLTRVLSTSLYGITATDPVALDALMRLLGDPDTELTVRIGISAVFEGMEGNPALQRTLPALIALSAHRDAHIRGDAAHLLSLTHDPAVQPHLQRLLADEVADVREIAREGLERLAASIKP
jgi:hypothetical protein